MNIVTPLDNVVYEFVLSYSHTHVDAPHVGLIARELKTNPSAVWKSVERLVDQGILERERGWGTPVLIRNLMEEEIT